MQVFIVVVHSVICHLIRRSMVIRLNLSLINCQALDFSITYTFSMVTANFFSLTPLANLYSSPLSKQDCLLI